MLQDIILLQDKLSIDSNQALFLYAAYNGMYNITISEKGLYDLVYKGYLKNGNKLTSEGNKVVQEVLEDGKSIHKQTSQISYPILNEQTGALVKGLAKNFLKDKLTQAEFDKIKKYCPHNPMMVPYLFIFFQLFPTNNSKANKTWDTHFASEWDNVNLRRITQGTVNKIAAIWRNKDIGLFLFGTYLFIKGCYNSKSGKYYIKNIENYMREYDSWYDDAKESLDAGDFDNVLSKYSNSRTDNNNTIAI